MRLKKNLSKNEQGQALVEVALILPVLLLLLMGIFEFGRIFNAYLVITNASREGARIAVVNTNNTAIKDQVKAAASSLNPALADDKITITPSNEVLRVAGSYVQVKVDYEVDLVTPLKFLGIPNPFPLSSQTVMRVE